MYKKIYNKRHDEAHRVRDLFFLQDKERALREVAREVDVNVMTVRKQLNKLVDEKILIKTPVRNTLLFRLAQTDIVKHEKRIWNFARIIRSNLIPHLNEQLNYPTIILFGSVARGENTERSDVDLCIITDIKKELDLSSHRALFNAEIQILMHTKKEFKHLRVTSPELFNNILNGIVIAGYVEVI